VILVHGDLATGDCLQSVHNSRLFEEDTPLQKFQFMVFVLGLFHLKMAAVEAIWKVFIEPHKGRKDANSLMKLLEKLRPKETGTFGSLKGPSFRPMHKVIMHVGIASRLDCWRVELAKISSKWTSLDEWAKSEPTWAGIVRISKILARYYVANESFQDLRQEMDSKRDIQWENTALCEQQFLLYEELTYAMNWGDIGRLEHCLLPWACIFQGCGKTKYSTALQNYIYNIYFIYPESLRSVKIIDGMCNGLQCNRNAVRRNMLVNPTGKAGHWRGVDWLVESNNCLTKVMY
jgi:hypothetical protein